MSVGIRDGLIAELAALRAQIAGNPADETAHSPSLDVIAETFGLSEFERNILALCIGFEVDGEFAEEILAKCPKNAPGICLAFALQHLKDAHWSALTPDAPLRRWNLIEVGPSPALSTAPIRVSEAVLHYCLGTPILDPQVAALSSWIDAKGDLPAPQQAAADRIVSCWQNIAGSRPPVELAGKSKSGRRAVAAHAAARLGLRTLAVSGALLPRDPEELEKLCRRFERDCTLCEATLLVEFGDEPDVLVGHVARFLDRCAVLLFYSPGLYRPELSKNAIHVEVSRADSKQQRIAWELSLGDRQGHLNGTLEALISQFDLDADSIQSAVDEAFADSGDNIKESLWQACRNRSRPRLERLAQRIEPSAGWDDLVLRDQVKEVLRSIGIHVRHRAKVLDEWAMRRGSRGEGTSAMFAGGSGTGKTLAAEVLAQELHLELYRIDLSQVVSKFIGETEKNLGQVFDAAEESGAILLFDEADALFGKRSEVKDSHDRYANIEVSYLLQRMETYRGLAILTTNQKEAVDTAFLRRLRFVVEFPFPDQTERIEIWRRSFSSATPLESIDWDRLGQLNVAGGNIRNMAMNAAYYAAADEQSIQMAHILRAAKNEYEKLERSLSGSEVGGWA